MDNGTLFEWYLHRLIMFIFCPVLGWENLVVNHLDGIRYHNWLWNLEWTNNAGNTEHALRTGLSKVGQDVSYATITNEQAEKIASLLSQGYYPIDIQNILRNEIPNARIKQIAIDIANGQSWKQITIKYDMSNCYKFKKPHKYPFTDLQTHQICQLFDKFGADMPYRGLLDYIGYDYSNKSRTEMQKISAFISLLRKKEYKKEICNQYNYQYKFND